MACAPSGVGDIGMCSGGAGLGNQLFEYWCSHDCPSAYAALVNTAADGTLGYNPAGQAKAQGYVSQLFATYLQTNALTDAVATPAYNNFQNTLLALCLDPAAPGVCDAFLASYCAGHTRQEAQTSPVLTNFCGCYVPPDPVYLSLTSVPQGCAGSGGPTGAGCARYPACDPLCHRALTVQKAAQSSGEVEACAQNVCVIDDVTVNLVQTEVGGGVNITNFCPGCGGGAGGPGCLCIVAGVDVARTFSAVGVGVNVSQFCGPNSVCLVEDAAGAILAATGCSAAGFTAPPFPAHPNWAVVALIALAVVLFCLVALAAAFATRRAERPITIIEAPPDAAVYFHRR